VTTWLGEAWRSLRFFQLFVFMVLTLLLIPLQLRFRALGLVLIALYLDAVAVSLTAAGYRRMRWPFLAGWALVVALKVVPIAESHVATLAYVTSRVLVVVLLGGCAAAVLHYVLHGALVSVDRIFAAIVAYMLAGLGFAAAYQAIVALAPESFALPAAIGGADEPDRLEVQLIYFSFVTIATLGYGDITPRLPLAQMLAVLEAMIGQFYVAVVIAWLVSVHAAHRRPGA
jgi:voltage-gated potassium channel